MFCTKCECQLWRGLCPKCDETVYDMELEAVQAKLNGATMYKLAIIHTNFFDTYAGRKDEVETEILATSTEAFINAMYIGVGASDAWLDSDSDYVQLVVLDPEDNPVPGASSVVRKSTSYAYNESDYQDTFRY